MVVVSNAIILITLAMIDKFEVIRKIFGKVYISQNVYEERKSDRMKNLKILSSSIEMIK